MTDYLSDTPISTIADDRFGVTPFAQSIARSVLRIAKPVGTVIALNGAWGSGKSSIVNLIRSEISKSEDKTLVVTEFKCWWFRGEEALMLAFLQHLDAILRNSFGDRAKGVISALCRPLLQAAPTVASTLAVATGHVWIKPIGGFAKILEGWLFSGKTVEQAFKQVTDLLASGNKRFLIVIDDIDRLTPDEAIAIFRLIKSVGHLPNVTYLLAFDRELADKAVEVRFPSEGPHFLEKIIQASFEVPEPLKTDLNNAIYSAIVEICGQISPERRLHTMNLFWDVVSPYLSSPRHVVRFRSAISVTWPSIANEVSLGDYIALETIRLYEPALFKAIRQNKSKLCGLRSDTETRSFKDGSQFEPYLKGVPDDRHEQAKQALRRFFPRLEKGGHSHDFLQLWDVERRVCIEKHLDTYLRLTLSDNAISSAQIDELVAKAGNFDFIQTTFRNAAQMKRGNGSMIPVLLDELNTHALRIKDSDVEPLMGALFGIHDEIALPQDANEGFNGWDDTTLRYHWLIRRLTRDRFDLNKRTEIYGRAIEKASFGWLVDFVRSAMAAYRDDRANPVEEGNCLVTENALPPMIERALNTIRSSANDGSLLLRPEVMSILYRWKDFMDGNSAEVKNWTNQLLQDDNAIVILVRAMTRNSWVTRMGFDGMGDRVATPVVQAGIDDNSDIIDAVAFRASLERILAENTLDADSLNAVRVFIEAWDRRRRERH